MEQLQESASDLLAFKSSCLKAVEAIHTKLNCKVLGLTTVNIADIENKVKNIRSCKTRLQTVFVDIEVGFRFKILFYIENLWNH